MTTRPIPDGERDYEEEIGGLKEVNDQLREIINKQDLLIQELYMIADTAEDNVETLADEIKDEIENFRDERMSTP